MILVDTSVWINFFKGKDTPATQKLKHALMESDVIIGDLILNEILRGTRSKKDFNRTLNLFKALPCYDLCGQALAVKTAENHLYLKTKGVTIRKTIDEFIATFCIQFEVPLLHEDRDFSHFEKHLGLQNAL